MCPCLQTDSNVHLFAETDSDVHPFAEIDVMSTCSHKQAS